MQTPRHGPARAARLAAALALSAMPGAIAVPAAIAFTPHGVLAQAATRVAGAVTSNGAPVLNARITIVGTPYAATTNEAGRYTIVGVPTGSHQLRVQRLGFAAQTKTIVVAADQPLTVDFALEAVATQLEAVKVVGYTNEQARDISGAVSTVSGSELTQEKVPTVEQALEGRVPGVQIAATGQPGRPATIVVRGQNGFGNPSPLYVVDGMYVGTENPNLNPDDIATINVLKDASAAAQYGAQASNGVIVITTRRGSEGPSQISLGSYYGWQSFPKTIDVMSASQLNTTLQAAYAAAGQTPPAGLAGTTVNTNWQDAILQTGAIQNYNLQAMGGSQTANYLISGSVLDNTGTVLNTNFRRYSVRVNSEARRGRLTLGENLAVSQARQQAFPGGIFGGTELPLIDVVQLLPQIPVYDPNNPGGFGFGSVALPNYSVNPVASAILNTNHNRSNQVLGSAYGDVSLIGGLRYRLNLGVQYNDSAITNFVSSAPIRYLTPGGNGGQATLNMAAPTSQQLLWENLLNFDHDFGNGAQRLTAVAGQTSQNNTYQTLSGYRYGFANEGLQQLNAGGSIGQTTGGFAVPFRTNSLLARATYALHDRYLLTGSARHDCSTRFSPADRCGNFGAGSVGWVASEEGFWKSLPLLGRTSFFKLRASTGVLGDQNIGDFAYARPVTLNINYPLGGGVATGAIPLVLTNPNLVWQRNRSSDIGLDFGVMQNALSFTADYYSNIADHLLVSAALPPSLASFQQNGDAFNPTVNAGKVKNAGFELGVTHRLQAGNDFRLNTTLNLTTTANRVLSLGNGGQPLFAGGFGGVERTAVGQPIGEFYLIPTCGVFQTAAAAAAHGSQKGAQAGDMCYVDTNGDGQINDADRVNAGTPIPKVTGGLFLDSRWKALDVSLNFRGGAGNKIYNAVYFETHRVDGLHNLASDYSPWTPTNPSNTTPRAVFGQSPDERAAGPWLESGNFLRIQNLIVGYTIPQSLTRSLGTTLNQPRVYVNMQNLYTFTHYSGYDPEVVGFGDPLARGTDDGFIYPNPRTITVGLDLRF